jgi:hypothetical protein
LCGLYKEEIMANQSIQSFGVLNSSGGGGGGAGTVTSIAAGDGITCTPDPITATGTVALASTNGLVTSFIGGNASMATATGAGRIPIYSPSTYPPTEFTLNQFGRATINLQTGGATARIGVGGCSSFDLISFTATYETTCVGGGNFLQVSPTLNGIFQGKIATPAMIFCDGTAQSQTLTFADFRVGETNAFPSLPSTDWIQAGWITNAPDANIRYTNMELTITQYSAT